MTILVSGLVIGAAVYAIVMLFALGICRSGAIEDEERYAAYLRLLNEDES